MSKPQFSHDRRECTCDREHGIASKVQIGNFSIWAGGGMHLSSNELAGFDRMIDLRAEHLPGDINMGDNRGDTTYAPIADYGTVAESEYAAWLAALQETYGRMATGQRIVVFCAGGHGRTGLFLASLLAVARPETVDPVATIRDIYCPRAVETSDQHAQVMRMLTESKAALAATTS